MFTVITETDVRVARAEIERKLQTRYPDAHAPRTDSVGPIARLLGR